MVREDRILTVFILLIAFVTAFACSWDSLVNNDIWWHLATGKLIQEQGAIPREDPFSYTKSGAPWITHSWLAELLFYELYARGGVRSLIFLRSLLSGLLVLILILAARTRRCGWAAAAIAALGAYFVLHFRLYVRPHFFSLVGLALLGLLEEPRRRGRKWAWVGMALLALFWANLHSGVLYGMAWLGSLALGESFAEIGCHRPVSHRRILRFWMAPLVFFLAALVNPQGLGTFLYPLKMTGAEFTFTYIGEFRRPGLRDLLPGVIPLGAVALLRLIWPEKRPSLGQGLAFGVFLLYALKVRRGGALFAIVAAPWAAATLSVPEQWLQRRFPRRAWAPSVLAVMAVAAVPWMSSPPNFAAGIDSRHPVGAADFIAAENLPGRMYNEIGTGGYLIWRLWPERKVFVDGRLLVYGAEFNEFQYGWIAYGAEGWEEKLQNWGVNFIVLRYGARVSSMLDESPDWILVYFDDAALIYLRNEAKNRLWLERWGCTVIRPEAANFLSDLKDKESLAQAAREAERMVGLRPKAYRPRVILGVALGGLGRVQEAEVQLRAAIELNPETVDAYNTLAALYA